ncbi:MAG: 50S ribosomal protein L9 [Deltaproteobacteria bacterium]|nr:50S ribosomal protein L9 [Deltaproteobacteria bacterium]
MKVILKKDMDKLGHYGDQVKVADGYARNFLIPKGLAVTATLGNMRQFEAEKDAFMRKAAVKKEKADKLSAELEGVTLSFSRKAGEDEKLFGSVTSHDIEEALKAKGFEVEKKDILLAEPIKALGSFTVAVKLHSRVTANLKIEVAKEE